MRKIAILSLAAILLMVGSLVVTPRAFAHGSNACQAYSCTKATPPPTNNNGGGNGSGNGQGSGAASGVPNAGGQPSVTGNAASPQAATTLPTTGGGSPAQAPNLLLGIGAVLLLVVGFAFRRRASRIL